MTVYLKGNVFYCRQYRYMVVWNKKFAFNFIFFIILFFLGYGCAGVSSVAYGLIARECERFVIK